MLSKWLNITRFICIGVEWSLNNNGSKHLEFRMVCRDCYCVLGALKDDACCWLPVVWTDSKGRLRHLLCFFWVLRGDYWDEFWSHWQWQDSTYKIICLPALELRWNGSFICVDCMIQSSQVSADFRVSFLNGSVPWPERLMFVSASGTSSILSSYFPFQLFILFMIALSWHHLNEVLFTSLTKVIRRQRYTISLPKCSLFPGFFSQWPL